MVQETEKGLGAGACCHITPVTSIIQDKISCRKTVRISKKKTTQYLLSCDTDAVHVLNKL